MKQGLEEHCSLAWQGLGQQSAGGIGGEGKSIIMWDTSLEHLLMPALEAYEHVSLFIYSFVWAYLP